MVFFDTYFFLRTLINAPLLPIISDGFETQTKQYIRARRVLLSPLFLIITGVWLTAVLICPRPAVCGALLAVGAKNLTDIPSLDHCLGLRRYQPPHTHTPPRFKAQPSASIGSTERYWRNPWEIETEMRPQYTERVVYWRLPRWMGMLKCQRSSYSAGLQSRARNDMFINKRLIVFLFQSWARICCLAEIGLKRRNSKFCLAEPLKAFISSSWGTGGCHHLNNG